MFTNMDGSEKRKLTLIGKSQHPRCFPKDLTKLPVKYFNSANARVTGAIFEKILSVSDKELRLADRKVV